MILKSYTRKSDGTTFHYYDAEGEDTKVDDLTVWNKHFHKYDGPAIDSNDHMWHTKKGTMRWYLYNRRINPEVYQEWLIEMGIDIINLTPEDILLIDMKWKDDIEDRNSEIRKLPVDSPTDLD